MVGKALGMAHKPLVWRDKLRATGKALRTLGRWGFVLNSMVVKFLAKLKIMLVKPQPHGKITLRR
jgi:hypothetical protein